MRRTLDSDKRSIHSRFTPLVQSSRDKGDPQKQIRLKTRKHSGDKVFVCRARVLQPCRNDKQGKKKCLCGRHKIQVLPLFGFKSNSGKSAICLRKIMSHTETRLDALEELLISDAFRKINTDALSEDPPVF